jgi:formylglycine-generating enzyme required for sulfatase activity
LGGEGAPFRVKVADFGIGCIVTGQGVGTLATSGRRAFLPTALRGACTPLYASAQQMRGDEPSPRDDVFAIGVIWYQMLTGALTEQPGADWRDELAPLRLPDNVLDLLGRCVAVRPERRLPDASALVEELARLGQRATAKPRATVPPAAEVEEDEDDFEEDDSEDPADLAERVRGSLARAQRKLARAVELAEQRHDYGGAVRLLEALPEPFRDSGLLDAFRERRDRVNGLRKVVRAGVKNNLYAGLRDQIEELLELTPNDEEMRRLLEVVPWEPGQEVTNSIGMKFVLVPAGTFRMGSPASEAGRQRDEGPVHEVDLPRSYYLGAFLLTQEQYQRVTGSNPSHFRQVAGCDTRSFPVESVSWHEAVAFCEALSGLSEERRRGRSYRLPTEAEWERACRANGGGPFAFGASLSASQANFDGRHPYGNGHPGDFLLRTCAVGSYQPNTWGLYDMHGNVAEWVADWYGERYYREGPRRDPRGPDRGEARVLRGGSWQNHGRLLRSANREWISPGYHGLTVGFRVVLEVKSAGGGRKPR